MISNSMEEVVDRLLTELIQNQPNLFQCVCSQCMDDMRAYALNHLPPRYYSRSSGQAFSHFTNHETQSQADIMAQVVLAVQKVQANPWHTLNFT